MITSTSPFNERTYRSGLILEAELAVVQQAFEGTGANNGWVVEDRPGNGRGDKVNLRFMAVPWDDDPKTEGEAVIGQESQPTEYENELQLAEMKFDSSIENFPVEQNRVSWGLREERISELALKWGYWKNRCKVNHEVGNTVANTEVTNYRRSFGVPVVAHDANHIFRCRTSAGAVPASDAAVAADATCVLDSGTIDELVNRSTSKDYVLWPMVPMKTPFGELFVLSVHGDGYLQLRANVSGNDIYDLQKAAVQGGLDLSDTPFTKAEGFIYNKTLVVRDNFMPRGITSSAYQANTRTFSFKGSRAGHCIYGTGFTDGDHIGYSEYKQHRRLSILTDTLMGGCRNIVNGESWACFRGVHYTPN